jgi:hypothetical protein
VGDLLDGVEAAVARAVEAVRRADDEGRNVDVLERESREVRGDDAVILHPRHAPADGEHRLQHAVDVRRSSEAASRYASTGVPRMVFRRVIGATFIIVHRRKRSSSPGKRILGTSMGSR